MLRREPLLLTYNVSCLRAKVDALEADLPQVHVRMLLSENPRLLTSDNIWPLHSAARERAVRRLPRRASSAGTLRQRAGAPSTWVTSSNTLDMGIPEYNARNDKHASIYPRPHPRSSPSASRCTSLARSSSRLSSSNSSTFSLGGSPATMPACMPGSGGTAPIGSGTSASRCSTAAGAGTDTATGISRSTTLVSSGVSRSTLISADGTSSVVSASAARRPRYHEPWNSVAFSPGATSSLVKGTRTPKSPRPLPSGYLLSVNRSPETIGTLTCSERCALLKPRGPPSSRPSARRPFTPPPTREVFVLPMTQRGVAAGNYWPDGELGTDWRWPTQEPLGTEY